MRFELFIARRYLRAKRRQAFIGIITGISVAGVAAGVASLVVALAINNGFRQDLQERLLGSTSHISLQRVADDGIKDWPALMDRLSKQPHVVAAAPAIFEQVLISRGPARPRSRAQRNDSRSTSGKSETCSARSTKARRTPWKRLREVQRLQQRAGGPLRSAPLHAADSISRLARRRAAAHRRHASNRSRQDMADGLGATVGSVVLVTSPQGELTPFGMVPKYTRFHVVGIFNSGFFDYDSSLGLRPPLRRSTTVRARRSDLGARIQNRRHLQGRRDRAPTRRSRRHRASWPPTGWSRTTLFSTP